MTLHEKYRPRRFEDMIGQDKAVAVIRSIAGRGDPQYPFGGRAVYITGGSGTGKSTLAAIMAKMMANKWTTIETTGRELTVKDLNAWYDRTRQPALIEKPDGWALIVNESHGMTAPVIEVLLNMIEMLKPWSVMIFTTTVVNHDLFADAKLDARPFFSRCVNIELAQRGLCEPFAVRAKEIAELEHLDGKPIEAYISMVKQSRNNLRDVLMKIETGAMLR